MTVIQYCHEARRLWLRIRVHLPRAANEVRHLTSVPIIPLITMSGFADLNSPAPDSLRMALELGAARCLRKPFTPHALLAAINDCLAEHRPDGDVAPVARSG
jgi:DNA-binding response OmpR family regulator